jgi:hypothetical protein
MLMIEISLSFFRSLLFPLIFDHAWFLAIFASFVMIAFSPWHPLR